jgi:hypothetical protein
VVAERLQPRRETLRRLAEGRTAASRVSGTSDASARASPVSAGPRRPRLVDGAMPQRKDPPAFPMLNADVN